jgi:hypothetical protein
VRFSLRYCAVRYHLFVRYLFDRRWPRCGLRQLSRPDTGASGVGVNDYILNPRTYPYRKTEARQRERSDHGLDVRYGDKYNASRRFN